MGYHAFDWRAWSIKPENKKLIAENMAKAVNRFKREQWLWEAKYEYLTMAYHPSHNTGDMANAGASAGTTTQDEIEVDLSAFAVPRSIATMAIGFSAATQRFLSEDGTLVYDESRTGRNQFRPIFKIYS
jgi:hypothetical protein